MARSRLTGGDRYRLRVCRPPDHPSGPGSLPSDPPGYASSRTAALPGSARDLELRIGGNDDLPGSAAADDTPWQFLRQEGLEQIGNLGAGERRAQADVRACAEPQLANLPIG